MNRFALPSLLICLAALPTTTQDPAATHLRAFPRAVPRGLPSELPAPADNPMREGTFALGQQLFFDPLLSADKSVSCASCHEPGHGFSSREALPKGALDRRATRHAPTLLNRAWGKFQMWDGAATTLEDQVLRPIANPNEMALPLAEAIERLRAHDEYPRLFEKAFGEGIGDKTLARALACFVRGLVHGDSVIDAFQAARGTLTTEQRLGLWVFESKGGCWKCHSGPNLSDEDFHNTGIGARDGEPEPGRFAVTGQDADRGAFKTPTLRGLAHTAPYMHDGSLATLEDVVAFYRRGGSANRNRDARLAPLELSDREAAGLVAFLQALSSRAESRTR